MIILFGWYTAKKGLVWNKKLKILSAIDILIKAAR